MLFKNLRKFHNDIKRIILNQFVISKDSILLDLACGSGGDLIKWKNNKLIKKVIAFDISKKSISEAKQRKRKLKIKNVSFFIEDLSEKILYFKKPVDIITIQFAFHYFFKSQESLNTILQTMKNASKAGTIVIISILNGSLIKNINTEDLKLKIFDSSNKDYYNNEISVFIKYSVLNVPTIEYRVNTEFLLFKMNEYHFDLKNVFNFKELYKESYQLSDLEKKYSFMNEIYIFEKK